MRIYNTYSEMRKTIHCKLCDYRTNNAEYMNDHYKTQRHKRIENGEQEYRCSLQDVVDHYNDGTFRCGYRTFNKLLYDKHITKHEAWNNINMKKKQEEPKEHTYTCDKCKYNTNRLDNYNRHLKSFAHNRNLTESYKYKCETCNFNTNDHSHYKKHLLTRKHISSNGEDNEVC